MSTSARPAWSSTFPAGSVPAVELPEAFSAITPEWAFGDGSGRGVRVAIIDSGVDAEHPAVGSVQSYVSVVDDGEEPGFDTSPHGDEHGHGTACAGIIRSLAPGCEIHSVRVLGPQLTGRGQIFAAGLRWAIEQDFDVCNLSLGTTRRDFYALLHELCDRAYFQRTMLVAAANNLPVPSFPSLYSSVVSVASHADDDAEVFYSNPFPPVEFWGRGIDVRVPWAHGSWITATGNSFATPHITGMVARVLGAHPGLTPFQVKTVLHAIAALRQATAAP